MNHSRVMAFIDWDTSRRLYRPSPTMRESLAYPKRFLALQNAICDSLKNTYKSKYYSVNMRFYHGWHKGKTATQEMRTLENLQDITSSIGDVRFDKTVHFGNYLLCGGCRMPLYDTLREREDSRDVEQKMVDTAIVSDLLYCSRRKLADIALVIGSDDDLIPGIITAEAWNDCNVLYVTPREHINRHNNFNNLYYQYRVQP